MQLFDNLVHHQNEFLRKYISPDVVTVPPTAVTYDSLLGVITEEYKATVSMYSLTPAEAEAMNNGCPFQLSRILHRVSREGLLVAVISSV